MLATFTFRGNSWVFFLKPPKILSIADKSLLFSSVSWKLQYYITWNFGKMSGGTGTLSQLCAKEMR